MTGNLRGDVIALVFALSFAVTAYAQPGGPQAPPGQTMPGMKMQKDPSMDVQTMKKQCAQMSRQMKPGNSMNSDMQRMMAQCDRMDAQTNNAPGDSPEPRQRTR